MMLKIVPMIMKNQRPTIAWRIWSAARRVEPRNASIDVACWPNVFDSRMPLTLSVSSVMARHLGQRLLGLGADLAADLADAVGQVQEERQSARATGAVSRQSMRNIATTVLIAIARLLVTRAGRVGDDRLDAADVVGEAALDLAGAGLGEEAQRHPLEVGVQRAAQVLHDVLADDVVEVALADADEAGDDRQHDHQPDVQVELAEVLAGDRVVDEQLEQERVDRAR